MAEEIQGKSKSGKGRSLYLEFSVYISGIAVIFVMLTVSFNLNREMRLLEENREERVRILLATFSKLAAKAADKGDLRLLFQGALEGIFHPNHIFSRLHIGTDDSRTARDMQGAPTELATNDRAFFLEGDISTALRALGGNEQIHFSNRFFLRSGYRISPQATPLPGTLDI